MPSRASTGEITERARDYSFSADFWRRFSKSYWRRGPAVFKNPFGAPIVSHEELFRTLQFPVEPTKIREYFRFHVDGGEVQNGFSRMVPDSGDKSLAAFTQRLHKETEGRKFGMSCGDFHERLGWGGWTRFRKFISGLYARVGMPSTQAEVTLFFGDYENSEQGVHLDDADIFLFVVDGIKRIRLWPLPTFQGHWSLSGLNRAAYQRYLDRSVLLEGAPGDILFWPASYWHVGEASGSVQASLSLGLHYSDELKRRVHRFYSSHIDTLCRPEASFTKRRFGPAADSPAKLAKDLARELERDVASINRVRRSVVRGPSQIDILRRYLEDLSGFAFHKKLPPFTTARLRRGERVRVDIRMPIRWHKHKKSLIVAVAGRSALVPFAPELRALLVALNTGRPIGLDDVATKFVSRRMPAAEIVEFLNQLFQIGAFPNGAEATA